MIFLNPNAVSTSSRRNKKREIQTLCMLSLVGLTLFMLSGCVTSPSGSSAPTSSAEKGTGDGGGGGGGGY